MAGFIPANNNRPGGFPDKYNIMVNEDKKELIKTILKDCENLRSLLVQAQRGDDGNLPERVDDSIFELRRSIYRTCELLKDTISE